MSLIKFQELSFMLLAVEVILILLLSVICQ